MALLAALQPMAAYGVPPGLYDAPASATDHVVVMDVIQGACIGCGPHRRTIMRTGQWVREERAFADRTETLFADLRTLTSYRIVRSRSGQVQSLAVETSSNSVISTLRREPTQHRGHVSSESCQVWLIKGEYFEREVCETADGIQLWSRSPDNLHASRSNSIERRPVREEEVRPPAEFFQLAPWPTFATMPNLGYELRLGTSSRDRVRNELRRRQGEARYVSRESEDGSRYTSASDGSSRYSFSEDPEGRPLKLEVELLSHDPWLPASDWEPAPERRQQTLLGERCIWHRNTSSTDVYHECRTRDGVPLIIDVDWHWDSRNDLWIARNLSRRTMISSEFAPPARATDWSNWGIGER